MNAMNKKNVSFESMQELVSNALADSRQGRDDVKADGKNGVRIPLVSDARRLADGAYSDACINIYASCDKFDRENDCVHLDVRMDMSHVANVSLADAATAAENLKFAMVVFQNLQKIADEFCVKC